MVTTTNEEHIIIKGIINTRCKDGASVNDIITDYLDLIGRRWSMADKTLHEIHCYLRNIDGVYCSENPGGFLNWFVQSKEMKHITNFIIAQKPSQLKHSCNKTINEWVDTCEYPKSNRKECFYKDNYVYKYRRCGLQLKSSNNDGRNDTAFFDAQLMGDDFFLSLLTYEIGLRYAMKNSIRQCGLCRSGLSIRSAINLIQSVAFIKTSSIILNVGSIDILHGHDLVDMLADYNELIRACEERNITPIITTIAPLANNNHTPESREKLRSFNSYLYDRFFPKYRIIDIRSQMVSPSGSTLYDCYQPESKYVSGSNQPHVLWNRLGRQRILQFIKKNL